MSDEDLQRMPYADLWQSELGQPVRQYHEGMPPPKPDRRRRLPRPVRVPPERAAPDPNSDPPRA